MRFVGFRRLFRFVTLAVLSAALIGGLLKLSYAQSTPPTQPLNPSDLQLHGKKLVAAYCAGCHGMDGNSADPQYAKIAGQKASYLRAQLRAFKSSERKSDIMSGPASAISDAQIVELAQYFSQQTRKPDVVNDRQLARLGARIYNASNCGGVPPCAACHGGRGFGRGFGSGGVMGRGMMGGGMMGGHMGMMGNTVGVPNLNGQHATYTIQQLDAFANGMRRGTVMNNIAAALNEQDRKAVAEYLSGRH